MKDNYFIDTNIFIYTFDLKDDFKREKAKEIVKTALIDGKGFISTQVIQEFYNVATRKFKSPMNILSAKKYLENIFAQLNIVHPDFKFISNGLDIAATTKYSFYDSLIISAALKSGSSVLLTEDMHHGHRIQGLEIKNPFYATLP